MKHKITGKWVFVLVMMLLLNAFYMTSIVNAKEVNKQATKSITLSPEQVGANYKKLKGYKVRTVVWIDHYTLGTPYTHAREDSDKYKFDVHPVSNEKVKKNNYIVIVATVGRKSFGYIGLKDAEIVGKGSYAKNLLAKIDDKESANAPDIDGYIRKINQLKKKAAEASRAEEKRSENGFAPIANGASGDSVVEIQKKLIALGFLASSADGAFGPGTEQAVKDFQKANHLEATGIVNEKTYNAIRNAEVPPQQEQTTFNLIKKGDTGESVAEIQARLIGLGYLTSSADGNFGSGTEQAVMNFQEANNLGPDGVVGENTYNKMFSSEAKRYIAPTPTPTNKPIQRSASVETSSSDGPMVWITRTGSRYHSKSNCGSTKNAWQVPLSEAERKGLTPCGKCMR